MFADPPVAPVATKDHDGDTDMAEEQKQTDAAYSGKSSKLASQKVGHVTAALIPNPEAVDLEDEDGDTL